MEKSNRSSKFKNMEKEAQVDSWYPTPLWSTGFAGQAAYNALPTGVRDPIMWGASNVIEPAVNWLSQKTAAPGTDPFIDSMKATMANAPQIEAAAYHLHPAIGQAAGNALNAVNWAGNVPINTAIGVGQKIAQPLQQAAQPLLNAAQPLVNQISNLKQNSLAFPTAGAGGAALASQVAAPFAAQVAGGLGLAAPIAAGGAGAYWAGQQLNKARSQEIASGESSSAQMGQYLSQLFQKAQNATSPQEKAHYQQLYNQYLAGQRQASKFRPMTKTAQWNPAYMWSPMQGLHYSPIAPPEEVGSSDQIKEYLSPSKIPSHLLNYVIRDKTAPGSVPLPEMLGHLKENETYYQELANKVHPALGQSVGGVTRFLEPAEKMTKAVDSLSEADWKGSISHAKEAGQDAANIGKDIWRWGQGLVGRVPNAAQAVQSAEAAAPAAAPAAESNAAQTGKAAAEAGTTGLGIRQVAPYLWNAAKGYAQPAVSAAQGAWGAANTPLLATPAAGVAGGLAGGAVLAAPIVAGGAGAYWAGKQMQNAYQQNINSQTGESQAQANYINQLRVRQQAATDPTQKQYYSNLMRQYLQGQQGA